MAMIVLFESILTKFKRNILKTRLSLTKQPQSNNIFFWEHFFFFFNYYYSGMCFKSQ